MKLDRVIELEVSDGPELVIVPGVEGMTRRDAEVLLTNRMLKAEVKEILSSNVAPGKVISQSPAEDDEVAPNSTIYLEVSKGQ